MARTPKDFTEQKLQYLETIVGEGGNTDQLTQSLVKELSISMHFNGPNNYCLASGSVYAYLAVNEQDHVEFDVYQMMRRKKVGGTDTVLFKNALGLLTTPMLQSGYTIKTVTLEK